MRKRIMLAVAMIVALGAIGAGVALATNDSDENVTGPQADRAIAVALEATGGGTANSVEKDGEDGATWEVEVTKDNGDTVDVRLDDNFEVVVIEGDSEAPDSDDGNE